MNMLTKTIALGFITSAFLSGATLVANAAPKGPVPFDSFDMDDNGAISKTEFTNTVKNIKSTGAPKFEEVDSDKNGSIDKMELAVAQGKHGHGKTSALTAKQGTGWQWK